MSERRPVLPNLTALRIFAAGMVLLHHLFGRPYEYRPWYKAGFDGGYQGVNLFFVLSGFLLAYQAADGVGDLRRFYVRRLARVYPLYVAALLCGLPNFLRHGRYPRWEVIGADLLLLQSWMGRQFSMQLDAPSWSLSTEVFFYAMFPVLLPFIQRRMGKWLQLVVGAGALAMVAPLVVWCGRRALDMGSMEWGAWVVCFPPLRLGEFAIGMAFGLRFASRMPQISGREAAAAAALVLALLGGEGWLATEFLRNGLLAIPFALLVYCLAGWKSRWLSSKPMQLLGQISYAVYLLQFPLLYMINSLVGSGPQTRAIVNTLEVLLILPVSYLFFVAIEQPGQRWILRWFRIAPDATPAQRVLVSG